MVLVTGMRSFGSMIRIASGLVAAAFLLGGCSSSESMCSGNCPDVSGTFSLLAVQPQGTCAFSSYLPPPTLTIAQTEGGRHVATQVIDPVNQLQVSLNGSVLSPESSESGSFQINTQLLRQATTTNSQVVTIQVLMSGTVSRNGSGATLSSTITEIQQQPMEGAGCTITMPVSGQMGNP